MPQTGQRISEYVLDRKIGAGAFGEVWSAHHHVWTDQLVAIKIPLDPNYLRNLQHEGAAVHGLTHPNIVRAMGFDPYAPVPYLVMEYVPGTNLRSLVKSKLSHVEVVAILRQVLAGLSFAHSTGLVHRDVKPENVLIHEGAGKDGYTTEGLVKVTDFGLGKATNKTAAGSILLSQSIQADNAIAGTLDYMAPEQRGGGDVDARADLYAVGVMLFELLTGERPAGTDVPSDINASIPKAFDDVFKKAYARLDKRFASAELFAEALAKTMLPVGVTPPPLPKATSYEMRRTTCPHCRQGVGPDDQFCIHCGVQLVASVRRCSKCSAYPDPKDTFCVLCGHSLNVFSGVA